MKKKVLSIILLAILFVIICAVTNVVNAAEYLQPSEPVYEGTTNASTPMFFANGTPIVITAGTDDTKTLITWDGGSLEVPIDTNVFAGGHEHEGKYESTSIIMNSGTVRRLAGGGLHKSYVVNSSVIVNGGEVTNIITGGGLSSFNKSTCHTPRYAGNQAGATTVVENAYVEINGGTIYSIFAAGEGISSTIKATLIINNGTITKYVTAGGSNGFTTEARVQINGGTMRNLVQTVNRGFVDSATIEVTGGTIEKLYVGGETEDKTVDGTISNVAVSIKGTANVAKLNMGTSGGTVITPEGTIKTVVEYEEGTVATINTDIQNVVKQYYVVTIGTEEFRVENGKTLEDIDLTKVKTVEGKEFIKFVKEGTEETFEETTVIEDNIVLTAVFEDVEPINKDDGKQSEDEEKQGEDDGKDETPKTSVESYIGIAAVIAVISLAGIAIVKKARK